MNRLLSESFGENKDLLFLAPYLKEDKYFGAPNQKTGT
jgi:hypothetical protein